MAQDTLLTVALAVLLLPLAAFTVMIFAGKRLPRQGDWLSTSAIAAALILAGWGALVMAAIALVPGVSRVRIDDHCFRFGVERFVGNVAAHEFVPIAIRFPWGGERLPPRNNGRHG